MSGAQYKAWPETPGEVAALREMWDAGDWPALTPHLLAIGAGCLLKTALSADERDDVLSRMLVRAWMQGEPPRHAGAWVYRVVRNLVLDDYKHERVVERFRRAPGELTDAAIAPDVVMIEREEVEEVLDRLRTAMRSLPDAVRRSVALHYLHGRSVRDIAEMGQTSRAAVVGQLQRGREGLRAWYASRGVRDVVSITDRALDNEG